MVNSGQRKINHICEPGVNLNTDFPTMVNESGDFVNHVFRKGKKKKGRLSPPSFFLAVVLFQFG
jgi:hypothetical protein